MKRRMTFSSAIISLLLFCANAFSQTPPPPHGPPPASSESSGSFATIFIRNKIQEAAQDVIDKANSDFNSHPTFRAHLRWENNAKPLECGYNCARPPRMQATNYTDRPNNKHVAFDVRLDFRIENIRHKTAGVWHSLPGVWRTIHTNVKITAFCDGWRFNKGTIRVYLSPGISYIDERHSTIESVLNFLLLPARLTDSINAKIREELNSYTPSGLAFEPNGGSCKSLGMITHYPGDWRFDSIIWDKIKAAEIISNQNLLSQESVEVRFISIKRLKTFSSGDMQDNPLRFAFFVNDRVVEYPSSGSVRIAEEQTLQLTDGVGGDITIKAPVSAKDEILQVIVSNDRGAAAWTEYSRHRRYGQGTHTLKTNNTISRPPTGNGGRPNMIKVNDFEITYSIKLNIPMLPSNRQ